MKFICVCMIVVGLVHGVISVKDFSKKINVEDYLYPAYLWQLDYSTDLDEIVESNTPISHGDDQLRITGDGRGYLKYSAGVSSATLGTFNSPCFAEFTKCQSGITYAFWFRVGRVVTSYDGEYNLLRVNPKTNGVTKSGEYLTVSLVMNQGDLNVRVTSGMSGVKSEQLVIAGKWYHVLIQQKAVNDNINMDVFVNMKKLDKTTVQTQPKNQIVPEKIELYLGKSVDNKVSSSFKNSEVSIDNIAVWKRILSSDEKSKIYLAEFGLMTSLNLTKKVLKPFEIKWNTLSDYYSHVDSYIIKWWESDQKIPYTLTVPINPRLYHGKELSANLEIFETDKLYTVRVEANVPAPGVINPSTERKFKLDTKVKGSEVSAHSDTMTSIKLSWKLGVSEAKMSVYSVSHNKSGSMVKVDSITSKSFKYYLLDLQPNTIYQISISKTIDGDKNRIVYATTVRTPSITESLQSSIKSASILDFSSTTVSLKFVLFPSLTKYNVSYIISTRDLDNPKIPPRITPWTLKSHDVYLDVDKLNANNYYSVDAELKEAGYTGKTLKMNKTLDFRIKDFYRPPEQIELRNATDSSLVLALFFHDDVIKNMKVITHVKVHISDGTSNDVIEQILDQSQIILNGLKQYTDYEISVASGDGRTYGIASHTYKFKTTDQNECEASTDPCGKHATCGNTLGSFHCSCKPGFTKIGDLCTDINECTENTTVCGANNTGKKCINNIGSFTCACGIGYTQVAGQCQDINECDSSTPCGADSENKKCINNLGSFTCQCKEGFKSSGNSCIDIDECLVSTACGVDSTLKTCRNTNGGHMCDCIKGYRAVGARCVDVNECIDVAVCGLNSTVKSCVNSAGSYKCSCNHGYRADGKGGCQDVDECLDKDDVCDWVLDGGLKSCINTIGSFKCSCKKGYRAVGDKCLDVNECLNVGACGVDSKLKKCENTAGSFKCSCKPGYKPLDDRCEVIPVVINSCPRETVRNVVWREMFVQGEVSAPCPVGTSGNASRECTKGIDGKLKWENHDLSKCVSVSRKWIDIVESKENKTVSVSNIATKIKNFVEEEELFGGDVTNVVGMIETLVEKNDKNTEGETTTTNDFTEIVVDVTSNLLSNEGAWNDLPKIKRSEDAGQLLESADKLIESVTKRRTTEKQIPKKLVTRNVEMRVEELSEVEEVVRDYLVAGNTVSLPSDAVEVKGEQPVTLALVSYKGLSQLIGVPSNTITSKNTTFAINAEVTSVTVYPQAKKTFTKPVVIVTQIFQKMNTTPRCAFWDDNTNGWSDKGCNVQSTNDTHVTCHCYHLTSFVVLMTVTDAHDTITEPHRFALGLITTIGIGISLLGLLASFLTFVFVRVIRSIRNTIHQHLVVALFIAQIIFLFGVEKIELDIGCQVIAAVMHYFFLVAFFIMGLEGIVLYFMLVRVYRCAGTSGYGSVKYVIWCWVLPIIFILINLIIDDEAYNSDSRYCWLSLRNGYIWSFVGPVLLIILCNFLILCTTLRVMTEKAKKRTSAVDEIWFWMKGSCLLLCILGVTWVLGILYVDQQTLFFAYIFNIINSLQGFSIFIFHCVCDPRVRKAYKQFLCCLGKGDQSLLRTNTRSTRMFSNASKASLKNKIKKTSYSNGTSPAEVSLMSTPGGTSTPNDSFGVLGVNTPIKI